jgi:Fur family ferric uptake transcriptional regulator
MKEVRDIFIDCLKERGFRYTSQREVILETFLSSERHITVEDLYMVPPIKIGPTLPL